MIAVVMRTDGTRIWREPDSTATSADLLALVEDLDALSRQIDAMRTLAEVSYRRAQISERARRGVPVRERDKGIADELAMAKGTSPHREAHDLTVRSVLVESLPHSFEHVLAGKARVTTAEKVAQVAVTLSDADRHALDAEIAGDLPHLSPRAAQGRARRVADRLDQRAALLRLKGLEQQRHVSIRPVHEGMVRLSALLPTATGVTAYTALAQHADSQRAAGEQGTRGQMMADELVHRLTGGTGAQGATIEVQLLMTDRTLLTGGSDPGVLQGMPVPGEVARHLALGAAPAGPSTNAVSMSNRADSTPFTSDRTSPAGSSPASSEREPKPLTIDDTAGERFIRRLYADPVTGILRGFESRRRAFSGAARGFILARDQHCRMPMCDAPIRHIDHVTPYSRGGSTSSTNGVGLCERHNYTKEADGWTAHIDARDATPERTDSGHTDHEFVVTGPSGITRSSKPPDLRSVVGRPITSADTPLHASTDSGAGARGAHNTSPPPPHESEVPSATLSADRDPDVDPTPDGPPWLPDDVFIDDLNIDVDDVKPDDVSFEEWFGVGPLPRAA